MDEETLQFYRSNAEAYARREIAAHTRLMRFLALLAPGAAVLELGCGAGAASAEMLAKGFEVRPTDGSPEMAREASQRLGRPVETLLFHHLDEVAAYDAVWANACLLHVPRQELAHILALIRRALRPDGYFYASSVAGLAARQLRQCRRLEFIVDRDRRSHGLRRQKGPDAVRHGSKGPLRTTSRIPRQKALKIASASTTCARKPTTKASVRNTGRPSV